MDKIQIILGVVTALGYDLDSISYKNALALGTEIERCLTRAETAGRIKLLAAAKPAAPPKTSSAASVK